MLNFQNSHQLDNWVHSFLLLLAFFTLSLLLLIVLFLCLESFSFWQSGLWLEFFRGDAWYPLEGQFGMAPMMVASLLVAFGSVVLALPLGLACAIFLHYYSPQLLNIPFRLLVNLLAGVPSVVFGLWGSTRLVPLIASWQSPGTSLLAAILVLALMILPTIILTSVAALAALPKDIAVGAMALGLGRKAQILYVLVPAARLGIASGVLLAIARALGETMVVLMVAGNVVQYPSTPFEPVRVLTANIALEMAYAMGEHRASLFASALILMALVWLLVLLAGRMSRLSTNKISKNKSAYV